MEAMSDFELHRLCQQYSSISSYQLDTELVLDSGKFSLLRELLTSLKKKVKAAGERRGFAPTSAGCLVAGSKDFSPTRGTVWCCSASSP